MVALFAGLPPALIAVVAGTALLGPFIASLQAAMGGGVTAAAVTFVVTASGFALAGIGAAFWGLLAGLLMIFTEWAFLAMRRSN